MSCQKKTSTKVPDLGKHLLNTAKQHLAKAIATARKRVMIVNVKPEFALIDFPRLLGLRFPCV